jgi:hypothetical protein
MRTSALRPSVLFVARALLLLASAASAAVSLGACTQDVYSSNPEDRKTFMGDVKVAAPPAPPSASAAPAPVGH